MRPIVKRAFLGKEFLSFNCTQLMHKLRNVELDSEANDILLIQVEQSAVGIKLQEIATASISSELCWLPSFLILEKSSTSLQVVTFSLSVVSNPKG